MFRERGHLQHDPDHPQPDEACQRFWYGGRGAAERDLRRASEGLWASDREGRQRRGGGYAGASGEGGAAV